MATLTRTNPKAFQELNLKIVELASVQLQVGWFPSAKYPDGTPVALAAAIAEKGSAARSIPPRPIFTPTVAREASEWISLAARAAKAVAHNEITPNEAMNILGRRVVEDVQQTIADVTAPPLSKITLMARKYREEGKKVTGKTIGQIAHLIAEGKGDFSTNTKPLIETKLMIRTVNYTVESKK